MSSHLPPNCGADLHKVLKYNPYQAGFQQARRLRYCLNCKTVGSMDTSSQFRCGKCGMTHTSNITAPRVYHRLSIFAGRRGGKSLIGAHAAREEAMIPNTLGWVCGPTFKMLEDSTMPALVRLIPPEWVKAWKQDTMLLTLKNGSEIAFRSLDDPERGRGQGPNWAWLDESAKLAERAWDVFRPSLSENAGVAFFTTSPAGFDWCYERLWKPAKLTNKPGFWACKYKTSDNPLFLEGVLKEEIEEARSTMSPELFRQEYEADFVNFTGAIYGGLIDSQVLKTAEAMKVFIPEWPDVSPNRMFTVGLDSGADHPFGAVLVVATERGLVVVDEYLERNQALSTHFMAITGRFRTSGKTNIRWASNKNEAQLRLEFGLRGIGIIPAENSQQVGIQRVQSWLHAKQLFFAYTVPKTIEQMNAYRYADNYGQDGQKRDKEQVFKKFDELPDGIRYALMAWPELPKASTLKTDAEIAREAAMSEKTRYDIARMKRYDKRDTSVDLEPVDDGYPLGDFHRNTASGMFDELMGVE